VDETHRALLSQVEDFGETAETVIRRLLKLDGGTLPFVEEINAAPLKGESVLSLTRQNGFQDITAKQRYLRILAKISEDDPENLNPFLGKKFGKRIQLSGEKEEIEMSGKSTFPEQIPGTELWAVTNLSNRSKRDILSVIMRHLEYPSEVFEAVLGSLPDKMKGLMDTYGLIPQQTNPPRRLNKLQQ